MNKNMFKTLLAIIVLLACRGTTLAAEASWYLKFEAVDALGNTDTLIIWGDNTSAVGETFPIQEAVNLYGVPPTKEIDVRILERTDTNYWRQFDATWDQPVRYVPYWLVPVSSSDLAKIGSDTIPDSYFPWNGYRTIGLGSATAEANGDWKVKHIPYHIGYWWWNVIFKITAKHFPVSMSLIECQEVEDGVHWGGVLSSWLNYIYINGVYSGTAPHTILDYYNYCPGGTVQTINFDRRYWENGLPPDPLINPARRIYNGLYI